MELRDFLEQDIVEFLDRRLSNEYLAEQSVAFHLVRDDEAAATFLTRDYEKELFKALNDHEVARAKWVLHDLKDTFESYPIGSPERKQLKALLHALYEKFKEYLEEQSTINRIEHAIDDLDNPDSARAALTRHELPAIVSETPRPSPPTRAPSTPSASLAPPARPSAGPSPTPSPQTPLPSFPPPAPPSPPSSAAPFAPSPSSLRPQAAAPAPKPASPSATDEEQKFLQRIAFLERALATNDMLEARDRYAAAKIAYGHLSPELKRQHRDRLLDYRRRIVDATKAMDGKARPEVKGADRPTAKPAKLSGKAAHTLLGGGKKPTKTMDSYVAALHEFLTATKGIEAALAAGDIVGARGCYAAAKALFPTLPPEEKRRRHRELLGYHARLSVVQASRAKGKTPAPEKKTSLQGYPPSPPQDPFPPRSSPHALHTSEPLLKKDAEVQRWLSAGDIYRAMLAYELLRDRVARLDAADRKVWLPRLRQRYDALVALQRVSGKETMDATPSAAPSGASAMPSGPQAVGAHPPAVPSPAGQATNRPLRSRPRALVHDVQFAAKGSPLLERQERVLQGGRP